MNEAVLPALPVLFRVANSSRIQAAGFEVASNKNAFVIPSVIQITTNIAKYTFSSFLMRGSTAYDVIYNIWRLDLSEDGLSGDKNEGSPALEVSHTPDGSSSNGSVTVSAGFVAAPVPRVTYCACGKENKHYSEPFMDAVFTWHTGTHIQFHVCERVPQRFHVRELEARRQVTAFLPPSLG